MALILREQLLDSAEYAVWKIEEQPEFYLSGLILSDWEKKYFDDIKNNERKLTWLASRYLLKILIDTRQFVELLFDVHGKPFINNFDIKLSLSHSHKYAAAVISKNYEVGIDIEEPHRNIEALKNKFLSSAELQQIGDKNRMSNLLIYWGAKEVIYKIYGKRKLEFKDDMFVKQFILNDRGDIDGVLIKNGTQDEYHLHYILKENFVMVVGVEKEIKMSKDI